MKIIVNVFLKSEILDPQGRAIKEAMIRLGLDGLSEVRQGKQFQISFTEEPKHEISEKIDFLAQNLLSNPVIEDYSIEVKSDS